MVTRCPTCRRTGQLKYHPADPRLRVCGCGETVTVEDDTWQVGDGTEGELLDRPDKPVLILAS